MARPKKNPDTITPNHPTIERMLKTGIPVASAKFQTAVDNADKVPETMFSKDSNNKTRKVQMWWCGPENTLLCFQNGLYFMTPLANVVGSHASKEEVLRIVEQEDAASAG